MGAQNFFQRDNGAFCRISDPIFQRRQRRKSAEKGGILLGMNRSGFYA
jgi:hypothetical protein